MGDATTLAALTEVCRAFSSCSYSSVVDPIMKSNEIESRADKFDAIDQLDREQIAVALMDEGVSTDLEKLKEMSKGELLELAEKEDIGVEDITNKGTLSMGQTGVETEAPSEAPSGNAWTQTSMNQRKTRETLISNSRTPYSASDMSQLLLMNEEELADVAEESDVDISHCFEGMVSNVASKRIEQKESENSEDDDLSGWYRPAGKGMEE